MARPHSFQKPAPPEITEPRPYSTLERLQAIKRKPAYLSTHPQKIISDQYAADLNRYGAIVQVKMIIDRMTYRGSLIYTSNKGLHLTTGDGIEELLRWSNIAACKIWVYEDEQPQPAAPIPRQIPARITAQFYRYSASDNRPLTPLVIWIRLVEAGTEGLRFEHEDETQETLTWPQITSIDITTYDVPHKHIDELIQRIAGVDPPLPAEEQPDQPLLPDDWQPPEWTTRP